MHCDEHKKYTAGCKKCKEKNNKYMNDHRKGIRKTNPDTQYNNGKLKPKGIYSEENWKRFNELGRKLTKDAFN